MYAHNNTEIDYIRIACANALMVQKNLNVPVTLVTDSGTLAWAKRDLGEDILNKCFENIIETNKDHSFKNLRNFADTTSTKSLNFYNCNHWQAYDLSPYDETLFIDADYLIMSSALNNCWDNVNDVMVSSKIYSPGIDGTPYTKNIDDMGIKLYWATVIFFRKSELAEHLFSVIRHVQENYAYYKGLYYFSNGMFRNDFAISIAVHTLNGYNARHGIITELPIPGLLMSWDTDDIVQIDEINSMIVLSPKNDNSGFMITKIKDTDIHVMNKWSINRHSAKIISLYKDGV